MATLTIHTENQEQLNALKAFMKAFKIEFEVSKEDSSGLESYSVPKWQQDIVLNRLNESTAESYSTIDKLKKEIKLQ